MTCFRTKFLIFLLLALATLLLVSQVGRYRPVGAELLQNADFKEGLESWQSFGPSGSVALQADGSVELQSDSARQTVGLAQAITGLGTSGYLYLSADLATESVVAGTRGWHQARLVLARYAADGRWLSLTHEVVALTGDNAWHGYAGTFALENAAVKTQVMLQLPHANGILCARGLSLRRAEPNPLYPFVQLGAFLLWGGFFCALLIPYLRQGRGVLLRLSLVLVSALLLVGILLPGEGKQMVLESVSRNTHEVQRLLTDTLSSGPAEHPFATQLDYLNENIDSSQFGHLGLFALLTLVLVLLRSQRKPYTVLFDVLLFAAGTELLQLFVVGRTPAFGDFLLDVLGALLGLLGIFLGRKVRGVRREA